MELSKWEMEYIDCMSITEMIDSCIKIAEGLDVAPDTKPILVSLHHARSAANNATLKRSLPRVE